MKLRIWTRSLLIIALLVGGLSLTTPAEAQTVDPNTAKVIWCPVGVTVPTPNKNNCTGAFSKMSDLWDALLTKDPAKSGRIWIGMNYINTAPGVGDLNQVWDGTYFENMDKYPLEFRGGWKRLGKGTVSTTTPSTFDGVSFTVQNWGNRVIVSNILVKNATSAGCSVLAAVCVGTTGNIKLDRVTVMGSNDLSGAYLNNMISVSSPPGSVTVTNSKFLGNGFSGLRIDTNGAVTLRNVTANVNRSVVSQSFAGVQIDNTHDATASPVNITNGRFDGTISYGGNPTAGLAILSNGTVTLTGVQTQYNQGTGLTVDNTSGTGKVLLKGTNIFLGNTELGLDLLSTGQVTAEHLAAYHNGDYGVRIETQQAVAITGSGKFNGNRFGLKIDTNGPVIARNLSAISNLAIGMHVATSALADTEVVILSGINAYGNSGGLQIYADGKVIVSCGASYSNSVMGLYVDNHTYGTGGSAALTLRGFYSYLNGSWDEGLTTKTPVVRTACPTG